MTGLSGRSCRGRPRVGFGRWDDARGGAPRPALQRVAGCPVFLGALRSGEGRDRGVPGLSAQKLH